jgi:hypothetical protein
MAKTWKHLTINLSHEDYATLKVLASINKLSVSAYLRQFISGHIRDNSLLTEALTQIDWVKMGG